MSVPTSLPSRVVLYDGVCGLCNRAMQWLLDRDSDRALYFAPLQGATAAALRARHPEIPVDLDTVVYIEDDRVYLRTRAFVHAMRHLRRPWRWLHALRWLPAWPSDIVYRLVARVRYRVFGVQDSCRLVSAEERQRFLP
jgi:predicted DCC family thiol-disulfide oxidoreductase YuxK